MWGKWNKMGTEMSRELKYLEEIHKDSVVGVPVIQNIDVDEVWVVP